VIRLIFTMVFTILLGLGSGYFLWGGRVARLTESLSNLTLEYDTLRTELASRPPSGAEAAGNPAAAAVNETLSAIRGDLAAQKLILDQQSATLAQLSQGRTGASCEAATLQLRVDLERCIADKKDLEAGGAAAPPTPVPAPRAPSFTTPPSGRGPAPGAVPPANDPRYDGNQY